MHTAPKEIIELIQQQAVVPLFYHDDINVSVEVVNALYKAGIRFIEYTNRGGNALTNFETLLKTRDKQWNDLLIAAGTIKTTEDTIAFINAGADCIISPGTISEIADVAYKKNILFIPGCMTATEIIVAEQFDAKLIKIFPGSLLGASYIKALKEIFPNLLFMPTGGVEISEENFNDWFNSGVAAVGLGSKVISAEVLEKRQYHLIEEAVAKALSIVKKIKNQPK